MPAFNKMTVGTCLSYNGVCMQDCVLEDYEQITEMDESSNQKWDKIRFTVSSMIVSNHKLASEETIPDQNADPMRLHQSQIANPYSTIDNKIRLTAVDQINEISTQLKSPMHDLVLWVNNATDDPSSVPTPPEPPRTRVSHRRIILAATGTPAAEDYGSVSGVTNQSTVDEFLYASDPWSTEGIWKTTIYRRQVLDCDRGPKCLGVKIQTMAGSRVFRVRASFEVCRRLRSEANDQPPSENIDGKQAEEDYLIQVKNSVALAYNRWSVTDSLNDAGEVTHTISGRLVVADRRYKPNAMRLMAFPLAFPFARLASREYAVSSDGKTLAYTFTYRHAGAAPPYGVRDFKAAYSEEWGYDIPGMSRGQISIKVYGWHHRSTDNPNTLVSEQTQKRMLLRGAHTILFSRISGISQVLKTLPGQNPKGTVLLNMQIIEAVGIPELELRAHVRSGAEVQKDIDALLDVYVKAGNMGTPFYEGVVWPGGVPPYDPKWWPIDNEFGRLLNLDPDNFFMDYAPLDYTNDSESRNFSDYTNSYSGNAEAIPAVPPITNKPFPHKAYSVEDTELSLIGGPEKDPQGSYDEVDYPDTTNPIKQPVFNAVISVGLDGNVIPTNADYAPKVGWVSPFSDSQLEGKFSYISYEAEVNNNAATGSIMLPLSKPRAIDSAGTMPSGGYTSIKPNETVSMVRLHAGASKRIVSIKAERKDDWPEIPSPAERLNRTSFIDGSQRVALVETLIQKEMITEAPQTVPSGDMGVYTVHMRLTYAMSRPWSPNAVQAGSGVLIDELFPIPENKILRYVGAPGEAKSVAASDMMGGNYA